MDFKSAVALFYGSPGSGKTVAATADKDAIICEMCTDNSAVVLNMFDRPNVDVVRVEHWVKPENGGTYFMEQFDNALNSGKYTTIVIDNLTDLKELALLEIEQEKKIKDIRQIYQAVYTALKLLVRKAANCSCNIIFTAWDDIEQITLADGNVTNRIVPNLPPKVRPQILGLCNIVGQMAKAKDDQGNMRWYLITTDSETRYGCKDQLYGRTSCLPENIFKGE